MYILLQGKPSARKSTAMNIGSRLLKAAGYKKFAPARMSRNAFLEEVARINNPDSETDIDLLLDMEIEYVNEMTIHAGEFIDFIGQNDRDYLMLLTTLWDNPDEYSNPKISKTSIKLTKPIINMISCNTPENLNAAFPGNSMDTGTLSRFIFVNCPLTGRRITFPKAPDKELEKKLVAHLADIQTLVRGKATLTEDARAAAEFVYSNAKPLDDPRFVYYHGRRFTHLLKLCLVISAMDHRTEITAEDVWLANTILGETEYFMPAALGHFGRSRISATVHELVEWIIDQGKPVQLKEIYRQFVSHFNSEKEFQECITSLLQSNKIVNIKRNGEHLGFTSKDAALPKWIRDIMVVEQLSDQERNYLGV